jgi:hypothetical protein
LEKNTSLSFAVKHWLNSFVVKVKREEWADPCSQAGWPDASESKWPNTWPNLFLSTLLHKFYRVKKRPEFWAIFEIFKQTDQCWQPPHRQKFAQSGVDVMITIFGDFSQFSAEKIAFFLNTNVMINFFQYLALFWVKNNNFLSKTFGENIFRIITSVPGHPAHKLVTKTKSSIFAALENIS